MHHPNDEQKNALVPLGLSRRDFLARSAGTTAGLYALTQLECSPPASAQSRGGRLHPMVKGAPPAATQQLPFWGDAANWDKPEYYETLQSGHRRNGRTGSQLTKAIFFDDTRDSLLIRGPAGMLINRFDGTTGQWMQAADGPPLTDSIGWTGSQYYSTIQTADIDGDGKAEILARAGDGLWVFKYDSTAQQWNRMPGSLAISDTGGWNVPELYSTLQCAAINGNVAVGCQLLGRGSDALYAWAYNTSTQTWSQIGRLPDLSDGNGWNQPQYYNTICYGDINGDEQEEVIARGPNGIVAWAFDPNNDPSDTFDAFPPGPAWSDANGWNQPQYYWTIQTAFLDIEAPDAEVLTVSLVGRGPNGIEVWNVSAGAWGQATFTNSVLTDAQGWNKPEYYATIQFADIDGDGIQELLARGPQGLQAWKVQNNNDGTYTWAALPNGPAWSDANGWNQVQYYSSIQTANSLLPGDPGYSGNGSATQAVVLARNKDFVETWTYTPTTQSWSQTTNRPYPAFSGNQLVAYNYITSTLGIVGVGSVGIRARYNDEAGVIQEWIDDLLGHGDIPVPPPSGVPSDDWNAVKTQILKELFWIKDVQYWYGTLTHQQIVDTFLGDQLTLYTIGPYLDFDSPQDNTALVLSILGLIAGALAAVLALPAVGAELGIAAGTASAIAGVISYTFSAAELALPGQGGPFQADYSQLQQELANGFDAALTKLGTQLFAMTGGGSGAKYVPGDYGLLSAIGQMIRSTIWNWPTDTTAITAAMQRGYATEVWKVLFAARQAKTPPDVPNGQWAQNINSSYPGMEPTPDWYPAQNALWPEAYGSPPKTRWHWLTAGIANKASGERDPPPEATLQAQFDPPVEGQVFPLGVSTAEFFQGQNGWPTLGTWDVGDTPTPPANGPSKLPALGVDLHTSVRLSRNSDGTLLVSVSIINRGLTAASNVEIIEGRLNIRKPKSGLPTKRAHLKPGKTTVQTITFPNLPKGVSGILFLSGRYLGGTFGVSLRLILP